MREKMTWMRLLMISLLAAALILGGCGDDGKDGVAGVDGVDGTDGIDGTDGAPGAPGAPGQNLTIKALEVHDQGSSRAASWNVTGVSTTAATVEIAATIDDKGNNLTNVVNVRAIWDNAGVITSTNNAGTAVAVNNGNGSYSITITPAESFAAWTESADVAWRVRLNSGLTYPEASLFAYQNDGNDVVAAATTVTDQSCLNCHGNQIFVDASGGFMSNAVDADGEQLPMVDRRNYHFSSYGVESCVMCHGNVAGAHGDRLMIYAHGIHNSNNFNGNYGSSAEVKGGWNFSVRYPAFMADCAACHNTEEGFSAVLDAPVTYNNCISCHGGVIRDIDWTSTAPEDVQEQNAQKGQAWRGFSDSLPSGHLEFTGVSNCASCHSDDGYISSPNHSTITLAENCAVCHFQGLPPAYSTTAHASFTQTLTCGSCHAAPEGGIGQTVADFHSGYTDRGLAQKIADDYFFIAIEGVEPTVTAGQYEMTWSAINPVTGLAYDVCGPNTVADLGVVTFAPIVRLAYFEPNGDDITNPIGNNPGQPGGTQTPANFCNAGLVTSTFTINADLDPEISPITRALALLKPQATVTATPALTLQGGGRVRIPAASYAFDLDDGAFSPRRAIVDSNKCLDCHGSNLYNHGGTGGRYDNVDSCIACHNSGATDQYVRAVLDFDGEPLTSATSYDGKDAETFSMAYNMHAIHAAGATDAFYVVYRGRGVYGYGGQNTKPQNWPLDADLNARPYLSSSAEYNLVTITNATTGVTTKVPSYLKKVNYPRPIADCTACHFEGTFDVPNQGKMVAVSLDSGAILADQNDDLLLGPASAACMSCHNSNDPFVQQALFTHADINGFAPQEFVNGKQDVLDFVRTESCIICH